MKYSSCIIGHITKDVNVENFHTPPVVRKESGGAVLYSAAAAHSVGHRIAAVVKTPLDGREKALILPKEDVYLIRSPGTDMENVYCTPDRERRRGVCTAQGGQFKPDDIPPIEADIYHLAGLVYGDYSEDLPGFLKKRGKLAVDMQGYLRHRLSDGTLRTENLSEAERKKLIPEIDFLKVDAAEAEILTGTSDRYEAAKIILSMGAKEVFITHNTEIIASDGGEIFAFPIRSRSFVGRTGRGDTSFSVYINERRNSDVRVALLFSTAAVSLKMEKVGVLDCNRRDVENYIAEFYSDFAL